jgi:hypothetical protein
MDASTNPMFYGSPQSLWVNNNYLLHRHPPSCLNTISPATKIALNWLHRSMMDISVGSNPNSSGL